MVNFMKTKTNRFFAGLLSIILVLAMLPIGALSVFAENAGGQVRVIVENTTYTDADAPWTGILVDEWVNLDASSSMMSCVVEALSVNGYSQKGAENNYIEEINGLAAFDGGSMSGWMGTLNDWFTNEGFGAFTTASGKLSSGDEIRIMYTTGFGADLGGSWGNSDKTLKDLSFSDGTLLPEFSGSVHSYTLAVGADVKTVVVTPTASNKNYQVRTDVDGTEYKRTESVPVEDGTVITVKCGDPAWPSMNGDSGEAQVYTVTVCHEVSAPELTLKLENPTVICDIANNLTATDRDGNKVNCTWEVSDESVFDTFESWNGKQDENGKYIGRSEAYLVAVKPAENFIITATSVDDPTVKASITFDIVPLAEVYAVVDGKTEQKLEIKEYISGYMGVEVPNYAESVMLRPAGENSLDAGYSDWIPTFDAEGFCNISASVGIMPDSGFIPEKLVFNKKVLPVYPADKWQCSRIHIGSTGNLWLFWEASSANNTDAKAENAAFYTPVNPSGSNYHMLLDRGADEAAFLFKGDATGAYLTDSEFKTKGDALSRRDDGYFAMPVYADDIEGALGRKYYILAENENAPSTKIVVTVYRRNEEKATPSAVEEYLCLASQYTQNVNSAFGDYGIMPERTLIGNAQAGTGELISLGNFGGYITYRFDELIYNDPKNPYGTDFVVNGNTMGGAGFSEPGNVLVSQDGETWYTLAGSDHYNNNAIWNYTITYTKNDKDKAEWTDSLGESGVSYNYPLKTTYPLFNWTEEAEKSLTVSGTLLVAEGTDPYGSRTAAFPNWGYVDTGYKGLNPYIGGQAGEVFDLDWAVDENGQPVKLDWVKYVKVQTASNVDAGGIGEKSTEVSAIYKTEAAETDVGVTAAPSGITVNGTEIELIDGVNVYTAAAGEAVDVSVDAPSANIYINNICAATAHFDSLDHKMVRVIIQEGEKEPAIYYINLTEEVDETVAITVNGADLPLQDGATQYDVIADGTVNVSVHAPKDANVVINGTFDSSAQFDAATTPIIRIIIQRGTQGPVMYFLYVHTSLEIESKQKAQEVIAKIDSIGDVSLSSGDAIKDARTAYDLLTKEQQALVTNYSQLLNAEKAYAEFIRSNEELEKIYQLTGDYIASLGTPSVGSVGGEWMVIGLARSGRSVPDGYYEAVVRYVKENINNKEQLHRAKSTDNSRVILALTSLGYDVTDIAGHNLLMGLTDMSYIQKQGINGPIWALIAFDSHNYEIPTGDVTRDALIAAILDAQLSDGGWSLNTDEADPDMTAMAIQALAPYCSIDTKVKSAVDDALNRLSALQTADGGYLSWGTLNSESCAQVIVALTALGIDPQTDSRFIKNGCSVMDALTAFYTDGGFRHIMDGELNGMATEQSYYALASYFRLKDNKTSLYNMSDVNVRVGENPDIPDDSDRNPDDNSQDGKPAKPDDNNQHSQVTAPDDNKQGNISSGANNGSAVKIPQTGDDCDIVVYFTLMALSLVGLAAAAVSKCKRKHE